MDFALKPTNSLSARALKHKAQTRVERAHKRRKTRESSAVSDGEEEADPVAILLAEPAARSKSTLPPELYQRSGSSFKPITAAWVETSGQWSDEAQLIVEHVMLERNAFSYQRKKRDSSQNFDAIVKALTPLIDRTDWIPDRHDALLRRKLANKMAIIRKQFLNSGYIRKEGSSWVVLRKETPDATEGASRQLSSTPPAETNKETSDATEGVSRQSSRIPPTETSKETSDAMEGVSRQSSRIPPTETNKETLEALDSILQRYARDRIVLEHFLS